MNDFHIDPNRAPSIRHYQMKRRHTAGTWFGGAFGGAIGLVFGLFFAMILLFGGCVMLVGSCVSAVAPTVDREIEDFEKGVSGTTQER